MISVESKFCLFLLSMNANMLVKVHFLAAECRAAESFSRPRGKLRIEAPCERSELKIFSIAPFRLA